jgi:hypothetical protein
LVVSRSPRTSHAGQNVTFGEYNFKRVTTYKHLGKLVTEAIDATPAVRKRILKKKNVVFMGCTTSFGLKTLQQTPKLKSTKPNFAQLF